MYARVFPEFEVKYKLEEIFFGRKAEAHEILSTSKRLNVTLCFFFLKRTTTTTHSFLSLFPFEEEEEEEEEEKEENGVHTTARSPVARHRRHGL